MHEAHSIGRHQARQDGRGFLPCSDFREVGAAGGCQCLLVLERTQLGIRLRGMAAGHDAGMGHIWKGYIDPRWAGVRDIRQPHGGFR